MKTISFAFVVCLLFLHQREVDAKIWALLVAGSNGWYNYRHQVFIMMAEMEIVFHFENMWC